jgi:hypothetical protein
VDTVEINWTTISYCVIGLFALAGFFRGWWKEAITTFLLGGLVLLLQMPEVAYSIIDFINQILATIWSWLPASMQDFMMNTLGITSFQIDAGSGQTWLVILIATLAFSIILSHFMLPNQNKRSSGYYAYPVTPLGGFFGGLLGGLNGFLIINLVREYLMGSSLPTPGVEEPVTEMAVAGGIASTGVDLTVTDLPTFTQIGEFAAWAVVGLGVLLLLFVLRSRMAGDRRPPGYIRKEYKNAFESERT